MVTAAQVKTYLQPLIDDNDDLALVGRLLVVKPVTHVLRGVLIDRRSSAETIKPVWFTYHMFGPYPTYFLSWGDELSARNWRTDQLDIGQALCAEISNFVLPRLRPIVSLEDFLTTIPATRAWHLLSISSKLRSLIDIATGDLDTARLLCRENICNRADPGPKEPDVTKGEAAGAKVLCKMLEENDIEGVIAQLHAWEKTNVKALKLTPYWQPSPFPIEEKLGLKIWQAI